MSVWVVEFKQSLGWTPIGNLFPTREQARVSQQFQRDRQKGRVRQFQFRIRKYVRVE